MSGTLSEQIVAAVGTGSNPTIVDLLDNLTATATEINKLSGAGAVVASGTAVANVADVATTGTYADDDDAIVAAINSIKDALVAFGIMAAA